MSQKIVTLMAETLEDRIGGDVNAFKPASEEKKFVISVDETVIAVNTSNKQFSPLKRGDASKYLEMKKILEKVGLNYVSRSE